MLVRQGKQNQMISGFLYEVEAEEEADGRGRKSCKTLTFDTISVRFTTGVMLVVKWV